MERKILLIFYIITVTCIASTKAQVDGSWSDWNDWHACTVSCEGGLQIRFRDCDNPAPSDGGNDCPGYGMESADCNTQGCPVDGGWSDYSDWSDCSVTCAGGLETRTRTCTSPAPVNGGTDCVGDAQETRSCGEDICPTNGKWTNWGSWTECNTDCIKYRYRTCTNPEPANGGRDCPGKSRDKYECSLEECPVNGEWGAWSIHNCDRTCRGYKTRRCDDPPPLRGGQACEGDARDEYGDCTGHDCVENGNWGLWSKWTKCSKTCMKGAQTRTRQCNNPRPRNGGKECPEGDLSQQEKPCFLQTCPVPPDYVRKVPPKKGYDINFGLILGTIFGSMTAFTILLCVAMKVRKYQLIQRRDKLVEEREQSHLYKEAAEMSIIPEGKKSAEAKMRRAQLKAKLKRNGTLNEKTPLMLMDEEDGSQSDDEYYDERPFSSMSSRPGSASSRPGSALSRPGTAARLRPSAYGRETSKLSREETELFREITLMDIFQDADYLKRKESGIGLENEHIEMDDMGMVRSDTTMSLDLGGLDAEETGPRSLLETPRPESTRPESREMRVDTPMMMKGLQDLDQQLREMAGFAPEGQEASGPGGITNLTQLLGGDDDEADKNMDVFGLTSNLKSTDKRGPGVALPMTEMTKATPGGVSLNNAMNQKVVLAQINHHPEPESAGATTAASAGLPDLQAAMAKKAGAKSDPPLTSPPPIPNERVFSRHSSLPGIAESPGETSNGISFDQATGGKQSNIPTPSQTAATPGVTFEQATNGKQSIIPTPSQTGANSGVTFEQATNGKQKSQPTPATRPKSASSGATLGLSLQQAMAGGKAPLPAITPPPNRRMMLDQDMTDKGVNPQKMRHSVSVDEALSSLSKPNIANAPGSPGFSPRRASMAAVAVTIDPPKDSASLTTVNERGGTPRGRPQGMNLHEAMNGKSGAATQDSPGGGKTLKEVMAGKTGQATGGGGGMNLREAMAAKTGKTQERKRGYDSVEDAMAGKMGQIQPTTPRKLSKQLPDLPPPDEERMWEVPRDSIELVTTIAFGTMGPVWKAKAWDIGDDSEGATSVAIKTLNDGCLKSEREEFIKELELMKKLDSHPHVVGLLGCCTYLDPLYMVLEYERHDALLDYLRRNRPGKEEARTPPSRVLINFAVQIAKGMSYLAEVKLPHGDLTTRNVLLGERMICKISNFSRERDITAIVDEPRHALRWMGVETIASHEYTTLTDIWSFGVLLWEIVTYGATPYPKLHGRDVKARVPSGYRMEIPSHCSKSLYGIMTQCWNAEPQKRPSFRSITIVMDKLLADKKDYVHANKYVRKHYESPY